MVAFEHSREYVKKQRPNAKLKLVGFDTLYQIFDGDEAISRACRTPETAWIKAAKFVETE